MSAVSAAAAAAALQTLRRSEAAPGLDSTLFLGRRLVAPKLGEILQIMYIIILDIMNNTLPDGAKSLCGLAVTPPTRCFHAGRRWGLGEWGFLLCLHLQQHYLSFQSRPSF